MLYQDDLDSKRMRPLSIEVKHLRDSGEVSSIGLLLGRGRYEIRGSVGKGAGQTWPILPPAPAQVGSFHGSSDRTFACRSRPFHCGYGFVPQVLHFLVSSLRRKQDSNKNMRLYTRSWTVPSVTYGSLLGNLLKACLGSLKMVPFEGE